MFGIYLISVFLMAGKITSHLFGKTKQDFLHLSINMILYNSELKSYYKIVFKNS